MCRQIAEDFAIPASQKLRLCVNGYTAPPQGPASLLRDNDIVTVALAPILATAVQLTLYPMLPFVPHACTLMRHVLRHWSSTSVTSPLNAGMEVHPGNSHQRCIGRRNAANSSDPDACSCWPAAA
jgi:hypothetical protein